MKTLLKSVLVVSAFLVSLMADPVTVSGKWKVLASVGGTENELICMFSQKGSAVTGSCTSDKGTVEINGTLKGETIAWSYKSEYEGAALTVNYAGVIASANIIKGTVEVPEFGAAGDFSASRSEQDPPRD